MKHHLPIAALIMLLSLGPSSHALGAKPSSREATRRGWLGVSIQDVTERVAKRNKLTDATGAYVREVVDHSPADSAGIKEGDVIVQFGDRTIDDADELLRAVTRTSPGTKVGVTLVREGEKRSVQVTVGRNRDIARRYAFSVAPSRPRINMFFGSATEGLHLMELNEQLGAYFGAPNNAGVLVQEVEKSSTADKSGFKAGDVIIRVGKRTVEEIEDVTKELRKHDEGDKVEFEVLRKGDHKTLTVELGESDDSSSFNFFGMPGMHEDMVLPSVPGPEINLHLQRVRPQFRHLQEQMGRMRHEVEMQQRHLRETLRDEIDRGIRSAVLED